MSWDKGTGAAGSGAGGAADSVVLVVEDEPLLRMTAVDILEDAGFTVLEAANGDEGLALLRARPDVRALFTDVHMPGSLDGVALAWRASSEFPRVGVIIVSGKAAPAPAAQPPGALFLPKPYAAASIVRHIQQAVAVG